MVARWLLFLALALGSGSSCMNQSFTTNTAAVTGDSDPTKLQFVGISQDTEDYNGEGREVIKYGTTPTLDKAVEPATGGTTITGPTVAELVGGEGYVPDTVTVTDVNQGRTTLTMQFGDAEIINTLVLTAGELFTLADAQGQAGSSSGVLNTSVDLSGRVGVAMTLSEIVNDVSWAILVGPKVLDQAASHFTFMLVDSFGNTKAALGGVPLTDSFTTSSPQSAVIAAGDTVKLAYTLVGQAVNQPNTVDIVLNPHIANVRVIHGSADVYFTWDDGSGPTEAGPFTVTAADLAAFAAAHGDTYKDSNIAQMTWDTTLAGHTLISARLTVTEAFATDNPTGSRALAPGQLLAVSNDTNPIGTAWNIQFIGDVLTEQTFMFSPTAIFTSTMFVRPLGTSGNTNPERWVPDDEGFVTVTVTLDAPSILTNATGPDLAAQMATISQTTNINQYYGFIIDHVNPSFIGDYGPTDIRNTIALLIADGEIPAPWGSFGTVNPFSPIEYHSAGWQPNRPLTVDTHVWALVDLYPKDFQSYPPMLMTEPYELRQRNLPAFKIKTFNAPGDSEAVLHIIPFVSQGTPTKSNADRMWTECPVNVVGGSSSSKDSSATYPISSGMANMPSNYGGALIILPKDYCGPYNYIRFLVWSADAASLSGTTLEITANAREL
jgi:hypothetical protein